MARKKRDDSERDDPFDPPDEEESEEPEASADDDADDASDDVEDGDSGTGGDASGEEDLSNTPAPSIGPKTTFTKDTPEERLARHEQSDVDAMGLDKRREVIGGSYSPSIGRQASMYGIFLTVLAAVVIGFILLANKLDQPPDKYKDEAPWSQADAKQVPVPGIDFPNYGHPGPGESSQPTPGETQGAASSENAADVETP